MAPSSLVLTIAFANKPVQTCTLNVENHRLVGRFSFGATLMVNELRTTAKSHGLSLLVMMFGRAGEACLSSGPQALMTKQSITSRH